MMSYRLPASALALLLVACSSTRHTGPSRAEEFAEFVLIVEESEGGQVSHSWRRVTEFDLTQYEHLSRASNDVGRIVLASRRPRDCDQEQIDCVRACMKRRLPSYLNHIKRGDGSKEEYCARECLDEYMDCLKLQNSRALQFTAVDDAVEWLMRNRKELFLGTVIVIAGVAFVTISAGAGAAVLVPVVLVAS